MAFDFSGLKLGWRPNQFLLLPDGIAARSAPHARSPVFKLAPSELIEAVKRIALAEPRTTLVAEDRAAHQVEFVQRSRIFRFPDRVTVAAQASEGGSTLAAYSRARYGIRDFGVNRTRIERWLAALPR
jgi:uncharacterized protein (DUF1499 family)